MDKIKKLCENRIKFVLVIFLLLSLLMTSAFSYAGEVMSYFIGIANHNEEFEISDIGVAEMTAIVVPKTSTVLDKVNITMEVIKTKNSSVVYSGSWDVSYNFNENRFMKRETYNVPSEGGYYMKVTYKCYKNNALIETITTQTLPVTYYM